MTGKIMWRKWQGSIGIKTLNHQETMSSIITGSLDRALIGQRKHHKCHDKISKEINNVKP